MQLQILQKNALQTKTCEGACTNCPSLRRAQCDGHGACPGYGTSESCPPLIVLAVMECASQPWLAGLMQSISLARSVTA